MQSLVSRNGWVVGRQRRQSCAVAPTSECLACTAATSAAICASADGAMPKSSKPGLGCFLEVSRMADVRLHRRIGSECCCKFLLRDNGSASGESGTQPTRKAATKQASPCVWSAKDGDAVVCATSAQGNVSMHLRACKRPFNVKPSTIGPTHATDPRFNMRSHWDAMPILEYWRGAQGLQTADAHVEIDGTTAGSRDLVQESTPSALGALFADRP